MISKFWKYLAIALVAANVIYWLVMPVWNWKGAVERELAAIRSVITKTHPELVGQQPAPPKEEASAK